MIRERGSVLIIILWLVTFLSLLSVGISYGQRTEIRVTRNWIDRAKAQAVAKGGVEKVIAALHANSAEEVHHPKLDWWSKEEEYRQIELGEGFFTVRSELPDDEKDEKEEIQYGITDEESRLNINNATAKMLETFEGITPEIAKAIILYRKELLGDGDRNESLVTTLAEAREEKEAEQTPLLNTPFRKISDLLKVSGVTEEILFGGGGKKGVADYLTCHSSGKVNVNTASMEVIKALGVKKQFLEIVKQRIAGGQWYKKADEFMQGTGLLKSDSEDPAEHEKQVAELKKIISGKSSNFRFVSTGCSGRSPLVVIRARLTIGKEKVLVTDWSTEERARKIEEEKAEASGKDS